MKNTFSILLCFLLIACSTNSDGDAGPIAVAPREVYGTVISNSQVDLSWSYDSRNETGFKVERKVGTGSFEILVVLKSKLHTFTDMAPIAGATCIYRVRSFNASGDSKKYSKELALSVPLNNELPSISSTFDAAEISDKSAKSGGTVSADGGCAITERGIVYGTSPEPTILKSDKSVSGKGVGSFVSYMNGLAESTKYYVRAYATNAAGTVYGNQISFVTASNFVTDVDGNTYGVIEVYGRRWTDRNLDVSRYRNGDPIPQVTNLDEWKNLKTGAWCYYENNTAYGPVFGKLYNWYAVNDPRGLAPEGYHIPTVGDFSNVPYGADLKGKIHALPGGYLCTDCYYGTFDGMGNRADFWRTGEWPNEDVNSISLYFYVSYVYYSDDSKKTYGLSVRCIKD